MGRAIHGEGGSLMFYIIYGVITVLLIIYILLPVFQSEEQLIEMRKRQTENISEENKLRYRLNKAFEKRVKYSTREKFLILFKQAGMRTSLSDFVGMSIVSSVTFAIVFGILLNNVLIGFGFIIIGALVPYQVINFIRNKRITMIEKQVGSFLSISYERYKTTKNMKETLILTAQELKGVEPIAEELGSIIRRVDSGYSLVEALEEFKISTRNQFVELFLDSYRIAIEIGTDDAIENNMGEVLKQYSENRKAKQLLKSRLSTPKRDAMIMLMMIPAVVFYQVVTNSDYVRFMTETSTGQIGSFVLSFVFIGCFWFINSKIGAPID